MTGLVHYLNYAPSDARGTGVTRELSTRAGMSKAQMYEYIGAKSRMPSKPPTEEEQRSAERFDILEK